MQWASHALREDALRGTILRGIEIAVEVGSPVAPPRQAAACLIDIIEIDLSNQQLRLIHARLLYYLSAEGIDDRALADVTPAVLIANPIGCNDKHAVIEGACLQRQIPDCNAIAVVAIGRIGNRHEDDFGILERELARRFGIEPIVAYLNAEANAFDLEYRQTRTRREIEFLIGARAAPKLAWKIGGNVRLAIRADQPPGAIEDRSRVVEISALALGVAKNQPHLVLPRDSEQRIG